MKQNANDANMDRFKRMFYLDSMTDRSTEKLILITTLVNDALVRLHAIN